MSVSMTNLSQARHIISPVMCVPLLYSPSLAHLCRFRSRPGGIPRRPSPWSVIAGCARSCLPDLACPILPARSCLPDLACPILPARSCLKVPLTIGGEPGLKSGSIARKFQGRAREFTGGLVKSIGQRASRGVHRILSGSSRDNECDPAGRRTAPALALRLRSVNIAVLYCPID